MTPTSRIHLGLLRAAVDALAVAMEEGREADAARERKRIRVSLRVLELDTDPAALLEARMMGGEG